MDRIYFTKKIRTLIMLGLTFIVVMGCTTVVRKVVRFDSLKRVPEQIKTLVQAEVKKIAAEKGQDTAQGGASDVELNLTCDNNWFLFYEEDENGNPVMSTITLYCDGQDIPVG